MGSVLTKKECTYRCKSVSYISIKYSDFVKYKIFQKTSKVSLLQISVVSEIFGGITELRLLQAI
jgi:hypothetical protein